jgi:hypothetical protein
LLRNKIHANMREGLSVGDGAVADVVENTLRANGNERVVRASGSRRGQRIHGDDAGSRPAPRDTSAATLAATLPIALPAPQPAAWAHPLYVCARCVCLVHMPGAWCVVPGAWHVAGAGVVVRSGGEAHMRGNQIASNAGAGVFAHADGVATLSHNIFRGNHGENLAARPNAATTVAESDLKSVDPTRAVTPIVVRRQRVPFDWTIGDNVAAEDKTVHERMAEFRAQYEATRHDKQGSAMAMLPSGTDPSAVCAVQ